MFQLTAHPLDPGALRLQLDAADTGALTIFEGRVRNHHLGRPVTKLEYEAFDDLALREGETLVAETEAIYPGTKILCVHRTGTLLVGEIAVWIGVASAHRQAGFAACRQVIEEIKRRLPVWKKEHHPDGAAEWVNCSTGGPDAAFAEEYYARQVALPEVGPAGQAKLAAARVLVVGAGGLGCPAALYLAGAGVGKLTLVDGGKVELSNLHRQILFTAAEIGASKALAAAARLRLQNPDIVITANDCNLTAANATALVSGQSVVLDCTDNFATRFLVHDACLALGVPLVSAEVHRFEGTLDVVKPGLSGCLLCLWPNRSVAEIDITGNCAGAPVFSPAVGVLGVMQAAEALKLLLGIEGDAPRHSRLVNLLDGSQLTIQRTARPDCPICGRAGKKSFIPSPADAVDVVISSEVLAALGSAARVVHLIAPGETPAPDLTVVATHDLGQLRTLAAQGPLVLFCQSGIRSAAIARLLRAEGLHGVHALAPTRL